MKKYAIIPLLSAILLLTACEISITGKSINNPVSAQKQESAVKENILLNNSLQIFFCPRDNCSLALEQFINSAESSIHCAFFDLDLANIKSVLWEKSKTMDVKVVVDNENYRGLENYSFIINDTSSQLSHNKFCIIDNKKISTGSMNPTNRCAYFNNNNLLLIGSEKFAENYESEFEELWGRQFGKGQPVQNPIIYLGNIKIENFFCPEDDCAKHVSDTLREAKSSIYFMTYSFTNNEIGNVILSKIGAIPIKGVFEKLQASSQYSKYNILRIQSPEDFIIDKNKYNMHHKVFIIDNETIITGSFNPTAGGDSKNDENVLIIHDKEIAKKFLDEFNIVWNWQQ